MNALTEEQSQELIIHIVSDEWSKALDLLEEADADPMFVVSFLSRMSAWCVNELGPGLDQGEFWGIDAGGGPVPVYVQLIAADANGDEDMVRAHLAVLRGAGEKEISEAVVQLMTITAGLLHAYTGRAKS